MARRNFNFGLAAPEDDDTIDDVGDDELEAELNALMAGKDIRKYVRGSALAEEQLPAPKPRAPSKPHAPSVPTASAASRAGKVSRQPQTAARRVAADSVGGSDEDESDIDENDPELLAELSKYAPVDDDYNDKNLAASSSAHAHAAVDPNLVKELENRLSTFRGLISNAHNSQDVSKARRLERLQEQISSALSDVKLGRQVDITDLPMPPAASPSPARSNKSAESVVTARVSTEPSPSSVSNSAQYEFPTTNQSKSAAHSANHHPNAQPTSPTGSRSHGAAATAYNVPKSSESLSPPHATSNNQQQQQQHDELKQQLEHYKLVAVYAKRSGNLEEAKTGLAKYKQIKLQLDTLEAAAAGHASVSPAVRSSDHNKSPNQTTISSSANAAQALQQHAAATASASPDPAESISAQRIHELTGAPVAAPKTIAEALKQRVAKYKESVEKADAEGNTSKARRMERIVKQYEEAIKSHQRGQPIDYESLPTPPGFEPIPMPNSHSSATPAAAAAAGAVRKQPPAGAGGSAAPASAAAAQPRATTSAAAHASLRSSNQQQLQALTEKQKQFKLAALKAKNDGDIPLAKEYLRKAKGLEQMIEASQSGLPVNLESVPDAPTNRDHYGYEVVGTATLSELRPNVKFDRTAVFKQLEVDLINQVKMCKSNSDTFTKASDIEMAKRFQQFLKESIGDLESLRNAFQHNDPPPKFHYETRAFNLAKTHADLPENSLELHIVRAVALHVKDLEPAQMDTYVVYDFPMPSENHQTNRTATFRSTNSPMYDSKFMIEINRRSRATERIFKKAGMKCEIFLKIGFLRADRLLGRVFIDLQELDTKCEMHRAFEVVDEKRKPTSGKLEVKMRLREPLTGKHLEPVKETWLVIDEFAGSAR